MAWDLEDLEPRKQAKKPRELDGFSVEELTDYIAAMEAEIARARAMIGKKRGHHQSAESIFKKN
jgi:uncharacterized small protein (DUF1192 family)